MQYHDRCIHFWRHRGKRSLRLCIRYRPIGPVLVVMHDSRRVVTSISTQKVFDCCPDQYDSSPSKPSGHWFQRDWSATASYD
ncbi:hypothetical protein TNCV_4773781 [Trichonephila clavipes]|nr:hypothetical protein TNCV_4773781 [Trichonephila clavipes]